MAIKFLNSVNADSGVLYVDAANDRVGIGTTSPSDILSVNSSSTETILHLTNTSTGTATSDGLRIGLVGTSAYFLLRENANMLFHTNNTERMRINSSGNVGIGTTSPDYKLDVDGDVQINETLIAKSGVDLVLQARSSQAVGINSNGTRTMTLDASNNVGIGTTSPDEKLTVSGNIRIANNAKLYLWNDHDVNFIDYKEWQTSSSGGMTIENQSSTGHVNIISNGNTGFYLNNIGNVGIGTTSPARKLQIGDGTADDRIRVYFSDNTYTEQTGYGMEFSRPASYIRPLTDNINNLYIGQSTKTWATLQTDATSHSFNNNGSTLMYIASDGDVGIGTTSPTAKLDVSGKIQNNAVIESKSGGTSSYIAHSASTDTYIAIAGRVDSYPAPSANASSIVTTRDGGTYPFNSYGHLVISSRHDSSRDILFRTNNTDRMVIQGGGNVGIGTTSPAQKLDVDGNIQILDTDTVDGNVFGYLNFHSTSGGSTGNHARIASIRDSNGAGQMLLYTKTGGAATEKVRITSAGNVGIGTTSPAYKLDVIGTMRIAGNEDATNLRLAANLATVSGSAYQNYNELLFENTGATYGNAGIRHLGNAWLDSKSALAFFTSSNTGSFDERMRIDASGNVGIGTTSPSVQLDIQDSSNVLIDLNTTTANANTTIRFQEAGANTATIGYDGTADGLVLANGGFTAGNGIFIDGSNRVGVGTSSPTQRLEVIGTIKQKAGAAYSNYVQQSVSEAQLTFTTSSINQTSFPSAIKFSPNGSEAVRIDNDGNVGIGTTSPNAMLHVTDSIQVDGGDTFGVDNAGHQIYMSSGGSGLGGEFGTGYARNLIKSDGSATIHIGDNTSLISRILLDAGSAGTSGYISLQTKQVERVRVTADGNVGIGTTSPSSKLEVSDTTAPTLTLRNSGSNPANAGMIRFIESTNTDGFQLTFDGSDNKLKFISDSSGTTSTRMVIQRANGNVGIGTTSPSEKLDVGGNIQASGSRFIRAEYDSNHYMQLESNSSGGILKGLDGGTTTVLVRSYGDSYFNGGNFGIGETSIDAKLHMTTGGSGLVNQKFESQGSAAWRLGIPDSSTSFVFDNANDDLSSSKFSIDASGNVTAAGDVTAYSDLRVKENVKELTGSLDKVSKMRGVSYNKIGSNEASVGVIAQEVREVIPELVREDEDGMLSVAYGNITAVLIEAIKEQQDIISQLEERIIDLENRS